MTPSQLARIQRVTRAVSINGDYMTWAIETMQDGSVLLTATNVDAPWYMEHEFVLMFVGRKGGIDIKRGGKWAREAITKWAKR